MQHTSNSTTFVVNLYDDFGHVSTDILRVCTKCGKAKDFSNFGVHLSRKDGKQEVCKDCKALISKFYRANNPEKSKEYCALNKEKIKIRSKQYSIKNADSLRQKRAEKFQLNKEKWNEYQRERCKVDPVYKIKTSIRKTILKALKGQDKSKSTQEIIGCTYQYFRNYIESQFEPWMTWDNKGLYNGDFNYGWDIDHIVPLCTAKSPEDVVSLNHYTNLRPLCSHVNRNIKRDKHE
jgi:hypothetical protein